MMIDTFKIYLPLCWLKIDPLDLPKSREFFRYNLAFYFIIEFIIQANMIDINEAFFEVIVETLLTLFFIAIVLFFTKSLHIFLQIASAVLFCENIVAIFGVPVIIWLTVTDDILSYYLFGSLVIWDYILITFIIKNVLSINQLASMVISLFYFLMSYVGAYGITILLF